MTNNIAFPSQLHDCVNKFLAQANKLHAVHPYDAVSASLLYAAARYNVHGFQQQGDDKYFDRDSFIAYMTDLYRRMLEENLDTGTTNGPPPVA